MVRAIAIEVGSGLLHWRGSIDASNGVASMDSAIKAGMSLLHLRGYWCIQRRRSPWEEPCAFAAGSDLLIFAALPSRSPLAGGQRSARKAGSRRFRGLRILEGIDTSIAAVAKSRAVCESRPVAAR